MELRTLCAAGRRLLVSLYCVLLLDITCSLTSLRHGVVVLAAEKREISQSLGLQCPPCDKIHCSPRKASRLQCRGGVTRGLCNCCPVCAKLTGEQCGGHDNYLGKCDRGLRCEADSSYRPGYRDFNSKKPAGWLPEGRCVQAHNDAYDLMDQPVPAYCRPKCSPDYCASNPRAVCSAIDNSDSSESCHGDCHHTSCRACRYVPDDQGCGKCQQDDFDCIKKFGRCIKKNTCTKHKYPCRSNVKLSGAIFQCTVPQCKFTAARP